MAIFLGSFPYSNRASAADFGASLGAGVVRPSDDTSHSGAMLAFDLGEHWHIPTCYYGWKESTVTSQNLLFGALYGGLLPGSKSLSAGAGLGLHLYDLRADGRNRFTYTLGFPLRLAWSMFTFSRFTASLEWTTYVFFPGISAITLANDRIMTLGITLEVQ